jgi:hypothetical protein
LKPTLCPQLQPPGSKRAVGKGSCQVSDETTPSGEGYAAGLFVPEQ